MAAPQMATSPLSQATSLHQAKDLQVKALLQISVDLLPLNPKGPHQMLDLVECIQIE